MDDKLKGNVHLEKRTEKAVLKQESGVDGKSKRSVGNRTGGSWMGNNGIAKCKLCSRSEVEWKKSTTEETGRSTRTSWQEITWWKQVRGLMRGDGWRSLSERREEQMMKYLGRLRRMEETRLTKRLYEFSRKENLPWWKD